MRAALVVLSRRLELLWREAQAHGSGDWDDAADRLVTAMTALEGYAGTLHPELGRRDWPARAQRSSPVSTSTRS